MNDFEYINWILREDFRCKGEKALTMTETKGDVKQPHSVVIKKNGRRIQNVALYRFDADERDFLPFFNNTFNHPEKPNAPKRLNSFCDYIIVFDNNGKLVLTLVEMKRGTTEKHDIQLDASKKFMEYVLEMAEFIKEFNAKSDFDKNSVVFRRVLVKECASNKRPTKPKDLQLSNKEEIIHLDCLSDLLLNQIL